MIQKPINIECDCRTDEHRLSFQLDPEYGTIYLHVFLEEENSKLKRVWIGVKYILGYKSKFGHFTEVMIDDMESLNKMKDLFSQALNYQVRIRKQLEFEFLSDKPRPKITIPGKVHWSEKVGDWIGSFLWSLVCRWQETKRFFETN